MCLRTCWIAATWLSLICLLPPASGDDTDSPPAEGAAASSSATADGNPAESDDAEPASVEAVDSDVDPERAAKLAERDRLWSEANSLRSDGQFAKAAELGEQMLVIEEELLGEAASEVTDSHRWLADIYESAEDWTLARAQREAVLTWYQLKRGEKHFETVDARLALVHAKKLSSLSAEQLAELGQARQLNSRVVELYGQGKASPAIEARKAVGEFLAYYNLERKHSPLSYVSPHQFELRQAASRRKTEQRK